MPITSVQESMRTGYALSAFLHAAVITATMVALPSAIEPLGELPRSIPVELVEIADETNIRAQTKAETPVPAETAEEEPSDFVAPPPEPPAPQPMPEPELAPQTAEATPPPPAQEPAPKPEPPKAETPKPETPPVRPKEPPKPKKDEFDINRIAGLIDVLEKDKPKRPAESEPSRSNRDIEGAGRQTAMTMTEVDALLAQMARCWRAPADAPNPESLVVTFRVRLKPDGSLETPPEAMDSFRFGDPFYQRAHDAARMAIFRCAPYQLPAEKYDSWKEITMTFDPRRMAGIAN